MDTIEARPTSTRPPNTTLPPHTGSNGNGNGNGRRPEQHGRKPMNVQLKRFVSKVITPVVLVAGLLLLIVLHFRGVLAVTTTQDTLFKGQQAFSTGSFQYAFQQDAGTDRPVVSSNGLSVLSWVEWSSTISVDGVVSNLWDNYHGYDMNSAKKQFFSTTTGTGFQVVEVVTLVNDHTVTVQYELVARNNGASAPHQISLTIDHFHDALFQPTITSTTLTAQVLSGTLADLAQGTTLHARGTIALSVQGQYLAPNGIAISDLQSNLAADGTQQNLATSFTTTYTVNNPLISVLIPLGTETLTYTGNSSAGTPIPSLVTTPPTKP
jgi:hypothetical protein